jgi:ADP-ribose pyrophosphatase
MVRTRVVPGKRLGSTGPLVPGGFLLAAATSHGLPAVRLENHMSIRTLSSREVYRNPWLRVREDEIERSSGARGIYGVIDKDDCAVIIPIEGETVYLVEQFRYTIQQRSLELPQGGWETADVDPEELARGELREETGLIAATMIYLGTMWIAYGFARQKQYVYLATGLTQADRDLDPEEHDLVVRTTTIADFERMLLDGTIQDSCTIAAWGLYRVWKDRQKG